MPRLCVPLIAVVVALSQPALLPAQTGGQPVVSVRLSGSIDTYALQQLEGALREARSAGSAAVIIDLDVRGGSVAFAQLAVGAIVESSVPVYAFVNPIAWGVGALIALAADSVFMGAESSLGWGTVTEEEADLSPRALRELRSEFRVLASRRGLDDQIAMAMVDPDIFIEDLVDVGERITLSPTDAAQLGFAVGEVSDVDQLLDAIGLSEQEVAAPMPPQIALGVRISVSNKNWRDVRIALMFGTSGSIRRTLGHVTSMNSAEYNIPQSWVVPGSRIQAIAEVIGSSERAWTEQITVQPGLAIDWVIANVISQSNYFAYIRN